MTRRPVGWNDYRIAVPLCDHLEDGYHAPSVRSPCRSRHRKCDAVAVRAIQRARRAKEKCMDVLIQYCAG
jgi:hypothetical protein